jgi:hypothetical protein
VRGALIYPNLIDAVSFKQSASRYRHVLGLAAAPEAVIVKSSL